MFLTFRVFSLAIVICIVLIFSSTNINAEEQKDPYCFPVKILSGNPSNAILKICAIGEGYSKDEQDEFLMETNAGFKRLFEHPVFAKYRDRILVQAILVPSNVSLHKDFYPAGGHTAQKDTVFKGMISNYGAPIINNENINKIHKIIASSTKSDYDASVLIVHNHQAGMASCLGKDSFIVSGVLNMDYLAHEFAHVLSSYRIMEEYGGFYNGSINTSATPDNVPWKDMIGKDGIGVYPSGKNSYTPSDKCIMRLHRDSLHEFCAVCNKELDRVFSLKAQAKDRRLISENSPTLTDLMPVSGSIGEIPQNIVWSLSSTSKLNENRPENGHNNRTENISDRLINSIATLMAASSAAGAGALSKKS